VNSQTIGSISATFQSELNASVPPAAAIERNGQA
jgi:hypothetical protein